MNPITHPIRTILLTTTITSVTVVSTVLAMAPAPGESCWAASACKASKQGEQTVSLAAMSNHRNKPDIVDTAADAGSFNTLVKAVKAAGLVDALKGDGPFTVFAPTDEAFAKLPKGTLESLLKRENRDQLTAILTYHVVPGMIQADDVTRISSAETLNGQRINIASGNKGVMIDDAKVIKTDIETSNGIIHVIDSVILPTESNIVDVASSAGMFNTLLTAATRAGLAETLTGDGPFTILAPTDEAFSKLPKGTIENLLKPENKSKLASILKYHVISGRLSASEAVSAGSAQTVLGDEVIFDIRDGRLTVDGANIIKTDIGASNGVVHVIDEVILPRSM